MKPVSEQVNSEVDKYYNDTFHIYNIYFKKNDALHIYTNHSTRSYSKQYSSQESYRSHRNLKKKRNVSETQH